MVPRASLTPPPGGYVPGVAALTVDGLNDLLPGTLPGLIGLRVTAVAEGSLDADRKSVV